MLLTDGLFEGHSGLGNERLGEEGLARAGALAMRRCRVRAFVDALIERSRAARAGARRADRRHRGGPRGERDDEHDEPLAQVAGRQLTVQGWQNLVLSAMGVVVIAGLVAGGLLMNRTDNCRVS